MEVTMKKIKRKRKLYDGELESSVACIRSHTEDDHSVTTANLDSSTSYKLSTKENSACCASNESSDVIKGSSKFQDPNECVENNSTLESNSEFKEREMITSSELNVKLEKLESTLKSRHAKSRRLAPSEAELDEFFAVAEKDLHKQFVQKYNFDFVKEEPLKGSYEWIQL